ncbi:phosphoenolpyruvate--protein phosphotransferase [Planotetraspora thailandica]|uniref:Phosphoenolpyruvate-protein phosphotransferase n=1 Tax=Planotetraspora thailandica TaxID=487172 RepID=A0A8J3Y2I0_9ACTN|nr:phosphoenolpyruvate--protein phosphotransferase [Planotetraspora thailandica]GII59589.1 phosphoenolpyruvate--protein phosphotransferase [Planotetraspora thailandica]
MPDVTPEVAPTVLPEVLRGLGISPGRAAGRAYRMAGPPALPAVSGGFGGSADRAADPAAEAVLAVRGLEAAAGELAARAEAAADPAAREILEAQVMIAEDPVLRDEVEQLAAEGMDAAHAVDAACARHREALLAAGGYIAERAADLDDVRNRAVAAVLGLPMPGVPSPGHAFVLFAEDLAPADTVNLDPGTVLALVTEKGGPTSHTAILARALGLPAVVACAGATAVADGSWVSVDGGAGEVRTGIGEEKAAEVERAARAGRERLATASGPGRTSDGHPVKLMLNIGSVADAQAASGAEGVGLFRSEFLYLGRRSAPTHEEQAGAYAAVLRAFPGATVVIRTLDAGTDKPLPFLGLPSELNPALGVRGLRVARRRPEVLDAQLDAIAEAAAETGAETGGQPWVMAPMVTTAEEAASFAQRARVRGLTCVGAMVEVPAAALHADRLLRELDFLSIGTNDLSQYTFASDRQHGELADLLDPWQPALLELVARCAEAGLAAGKPVGVCGEAAADPLLATVFAGLGVTSLSMSARSLPAVRDALARHSLDQCRQNAELALAATGPAAARQAVAGVR